MNLPSRADGDLLEKKKKRGFFQKQFELKNRVFFKKQDAPISSANKNMEIGEKPTLKNGKVKDPDNQKSFFRRVWFSIRKKSLPKSESNDQNELAMKVPSVLDMKPYQLVQFSINLALQSPSGSNMQRYESEFQSHSKFMENNFDKDLTTAVLRSLNLKRPVPILNPSRECFAIAVLHALFACPPFVNYVKQRNSDDDVTRRMKSIVAQYAIGWPYIHITKLLCAIWPNYDYNSPEDAEDFYRMLSNSFFDDTLSLQGFYRISCPVCGKGTVSMDNNARVQLKCPSLMTEMLINGQSKRLHPTSITIESMINETAREYIKWSHSNCKNEDCVRRIEFKLPDVFVVSVDTFLKADNPDGKKLDFYPVEDFAQISVQHKIDVYHLGGVIYHMELNDGAKQMGHYFAKVLHGDHVYLINDNNVKQERGYRKIVHDDAQPYLAVYYKQRGISAES